MTSFKTGNFKFLIECGLYFVCWKVVDIDVFLFVSQ